MVVKYFLCGIVRKIHLLRDRICEITPFVFMSHDVETRFYPQMPARFPLSMSPNRHVFFSICAMNTKFRDLLQHFYQKHSAMFKPNTTSNCISVFLIDFPTHIRCITLASFPHSMCEPKVFTSNMAHQYCF